MLIETEQGFKIFPLEKHYKIRLPKNNSFRSFSLENKQFYYLHKSLPETDVKFLLTENEFLKLDQVNRQNYKRGFLRKMESIQNQEDFKLLGRKNELFFFYDDNAESFSNLTASKLLDVLPNAVERFERLAQPRKKRQNKYPYLACRNTQ